MIENIDLSLVDWSRGQFALTAIYHWLFVPLTLGLSFILVIMETKYVRTGSEKWKKITKFWMKLFGINFAIGVSTGLILEFEFGTNWSNYSWFVGDIFGAPLAIEGIMAFFLESTFVAVMFFGWDKVGKRFHLASTWLVAIGANLSALWILVANAWMENPVGMFFNPDTARNEMQSFWQVLFNPVAMDKFFHTITSGFVLASLFVTGISAWFLIHNREKEMAVKSIKVAAIFGTFGSLVLIFTGDTSSRTLARVQPVKFAAMEALYEGKTDAGLTAFGILVDKDQAVEDGLDEKDIIASIEIPGLLSIMTNGERDSYVAGIKDLVHGNEERGLMPVSEKIERGKFARQTLLDYREAKEGDNMVLADELKKRFEGSDFQEEYFRYFGYSYINRPADVVPNVPLIFYSFHLMVALGCLFLLLQILAWLYTARGSMENKRIFQWILLLSLPLPYLASVLGWLVTEMGRQPWIIQDLMPVGIAVSSISTSAVQTTFWLFAALFTALLIAEVSIMTRQIKIGPKIEEE
ncbi:MAG: cytochrome ubiquinol oxidase subunit I [Bacteroidales bacterium]|nr:cytochrome ubiquinol oxidase subunit I [Bacteroidales bacterium]